jgi:hypothetical protein
MGILRGAQMMRKKKGREKSLPELIAARQMEIVQPYLETAFLKRELPKSTLDPRSKDEILRELESQPIERTAAEILADMVLTLLFKRKKNYPKDKIKETLKNVYPEILKIYNAIKIVGFYSSIIDASKKWQEAALYCFDDSKKGFTYVRRRHLEENNLYELQVGKERETFFKKLSKMIIEDHLGISIPEYLAKEILMEMKPIKIKFIG